LPCRYIHGYTRFGQHVAAEIKAPSKFPLQCPATGRLAIAMPLTRRLNDKQRCHIGHFMAIYSHFDGQNAI